MYEIHEPSDHVAQEDLFEPEYELDVADTLLYWSLRDFADIVPHDSRMS